MSAFNLAEAIGLKRVSNLDTGELKEVGLDLIDPNPNNFFSVEDDITDLMESIKLNGLLQSPVVTPAENGRYRLIAGHRRHKALMTLWAEDPDKYKTVMCRIVIPSTPGMEELMLIQTNTESREIGYRERNEAAKRVEAILVEMQKNGVKLPGKMRSHVAKLIKSSESQIARASFIDKNLIDGFKGRSGMSDSVAYKLAHLPPEHQQVLCDHYTGSLWHLDATKIKKFEEDVAAGRHPFAEELDNRRTCYTQKGNPKCEHGKIIEQRHAREDLPDYLSCNGYCCAACTSRFDCNVVCAPVRQKVADHKTTADYQICNALREARQLKGMSVAEAASALGIDARRVVEYETNHNHTIAWLTKMCRCYNVTPDEVLGFNDGLRSTPPLGWILADQIGDLPDGLYFMLYEYNKPYICDNGEPLVQERAVLRKDGSWHLLPSFKKWSANSDERLVAVLPAPPIPVSWSLTLEPFGSEGKEAEEDCDE